MQGFVVPPERVESSQIGDRTHVPCIGSWVLIHCATRQVQTLISCFRWYLLLFSTMKLFIFHF